MSIQFCDGFDHYTTVLNKWDVVNTNGGQNAPPVVSISTTSGRGGGGAISFPGVSSGNTYSGLVGYGYAQKNVGSQSAYTVGFAINYNATGSNITSYILRFVDGATTQISLGLSITGILSVYRGDYAAAVLLGSSSSSLSANSFHYVEIQVVMSSTVGTVQVKIDGTSVINLTGQNTLITANASFSGIHIGNVGASTANGITTMSSILFDDVVFDNSAFNGDVRVAGYLPTGNGTINQFTNVTSPWPGAGVAVAVGATILDSNSNLQRCTTAGTTGGSAPTWSITVGNNTTDNTVVWKNLGAVSQFQLVNEPNPDSDLSYVTDLTVGDISRFTYPAIPTTATVKAVVIQPFIRKDDGGARSVQGSIKSGATVGTTGTDLPLGANYAFSPLVSTTDPNTAAPWTPAGVNAAEFGVKITL